MYDSDEDKDLVPVRNNAVHRTVQLFQAFYPGAVIPAANRRAANGNN